MKKTRVLVTGGDGFIGSNFIIHLLSNPGSEFEVFNIDKQTYAGQGRNLEHAGFSSDPRHYSERGDIARAELVDRIFCEFSPDYVFNFAAESHVDRSISVPEPFVSSNVLGTLNLLNAAKKSADRKHPIKKFIQISTDEVYGSIPVGSFSEGYILNPSSAYSASKASAEHFAQAYLKTHGVPVIITRSANNYGPYQFPEKLLPLFITNLIQGKKVPLMGTKKNPGSNVRDWLHVEDNCRAILHLGLNAAPGEIFNIPGENERTNLYMTRMLLKFFGLNEDRIEVVPDRLGHDFRYSISGNKLKRFGFKYKHKDLESEIEKLCEWHVNNEEWWRRAIKLSEEK